MIASRQYNLIHEHEEETPVFALVRRSCVLPARPTLRAPSTRPAPFIVDKRQLVALARVVRMIPGTVPPVVTPLTVLVQEQRAALRRRAAERTWLRRIAVVALIGGVMVLASRPAIGARALQRVQGWCVAARVQLNAASARLPIRR